mgnify:CR=1 FL=1
MDNRKKKTSGSPATEKPKKSATRNRTMTLKVSDEQYRRIKELAARCGLTTSSYMLARAYNYQPKQRLPNEALEALQTLIHARADITKYSNALGAMKESEKINFFRRYSFMIDWLTDLNTLGERINAFLDRVEVPNEVPPNSKSEVKSDAKK